MKQEQLVSAFAQLGKVFESISEKKEWAGLSIGLTKEEYEFFQTLVEKVHIYNGWFTHESVLYSLKHWSNLLNEDNLKDWLANYQFENSKTIAVIGAGNIPMVAFHDVICVLLSGNKLKLKCSSDDDKLLPTVLKLLAIFNPELERNYELVNGRLVDFDAVIATGSNNSSNYFEQYFSQYPHIIRKNRTSLAIVRDDISKEELELLGEDIFQYFGLGCRNVSKIFFPKGFDLDRFFKGMYKFQEIIYNNKYANNYDYQKAIHLMNRDEILDNGFLLIKQDENLHAPLGMVYYEFYENENEVLDFVSNNQEQIQAFVDGEEIAYGSSQKPSLNDFADNVNVMQFIEKL